MGAPGFYLIRTGTGPDQGMAGALQARQTPLSRKGLRGFEYMIGVQSLSRSLALLLAHGGTQTARSMRIDRVGQPSFIRDIEGNRLGVMRYEGDALDRAARHLPNLL